MSPGLQVHHEGKFLGQISVLQCDRMLTRRRLHVLCPFFSDFLNLLSVYSEGRTTPRYLGVSRSLFRHLRHNVRFTWHHPSLISVCSFFMCSTSAKMQVCAWYRTVDVQFSACFLSPLLASSSYPSSGTGQLLHAP